MVPPTLKHAVYQEYREGQENDKRPSAEYRLAARQAIETVHSLELSTLDHGIDEINRGSQF